MKRKRIPPHLSLEERDAFLRLQAKWDSKLRDADFVDVEQGSDLNEFEASTLRGGDPARQGPTFVPLEPEDDDQPHTSFSAAPEAVYWRQFADAAHNLPKSWPRRALILAVAEAGIVRSALVKRHHLTFRQAMLTIEKFCRRAGISAPQFRASPTKREEEPTTAPPCRQFGPAEAKFLQRTMPARTMSPSTLQRLRSKKKAAA